MERITPNVDKAILSNARQIAIPNNWMNKAGLDKAYKIAIKQAGYNVTDYMNAIKLFV